MLNDIQYFMVGGTLLGAIRHGGFIPWDDDMDFGMVREEYQRFCDICEKELDARFMLQTMDTDTDYPFPYAKLRLKNTQIKEKFATTQLMSENGIFIDIFPYDNVPEIMKKRKWQAKKIFWYKRIMWMKKGYGKNILDQNLKQKLKYIFFYILCFFISFDRVKYKYKSTLTKYNKHKTEYIVTDGAYRYEKNFVNRWQIEKLPRLRFENFYFPGLKDNDKYLSYLYGDYMKLPKLEDRHNHDILFVDFGKY